MGDGGREGGRGREGVGRLFLTFVMARVRGGRIQGGSVLAQCRGDKNVLKTVRWPHPNRFHNLFYHA